MPCPTETGKEGEPKPRSTDRGMAQLALRKWLSPWPLLTGILGNLSLGIQRLQSLRIIVFSSTSTG